LPPPAPASGLALVGVGYDDVDGGPSGSAFDVARSTQIIL
jgi:hypothetical protein